MVRRARKPLLPQLIWGPQKTTNRRTRQVTVVRVSALANTTQRLCENAFLVAAGACLGLTLGFVLGLNLA